MNRNKQLFDLIRDKKVLFVIGSPFQALCAVEAIREFNIKNFSIICLEYWNDNRRTQVKNILDAYKLEFEQKVLSRCTFVSFFLKSFFHKPKYDIAFVGDIYAYDFRILALSKISRNSQIIFMDDGNTTIDILNGISHLRTRIFPIRLYLENIIRYVKNIPKEVSFYTIFDDIDTRNYKVFSNSLSHLDIFGNNKYNKERIGYFLGTNPAGYRQLYGISTEDYRCMVQNLLLEMKNIVGTLIYVPHGRDYNDEMESFCLSNGIQYKKLGVCIEYYLLSISDNIFLVAGFTSTALFTIKKVFPNCDVRNYILNKETSLSSEIKRVSDYYSKKGIENFFIGA